MISFTVYGEPVAQGRPRATKVGGFIRMYDPAKSKDYKDYVRLTASEHAPKELMTGPIAVKIDVYRPTPKSFSKKKALEAESGYIRPITKPDVDNYVKGIKDALKSVIWQDDSQVVKIVADKWYSSKPRVEVKIKQVKEGII